MFDDGDKIIHQYAKKQKTTQINIRYYGGIGQVWLYYCLNCGAKNNAKNHEKCWYCGKPKENVAESPTKIR